MQLAEEVFDIGGEVEVGLTVGELGVEGLDLVARLVSLARRPGMRACSSSMLTSCSVNASIMLAIPALVLANAVLSRSRSRGESLIVGQPVRETKVSSLTLTSGTRRQRNLRPLSACPSRSRPLSASPSRPRRS